MARIEHVIEQLERQRDWYEAVRDRRAVFTHAYAEITRVFKERLPTQGFVHPAWIRELDLAFAREYFAALDAYDLGKEVPRAWAAVFGEMAQEKTSVLEELLLSMAVHIVHDLPLALTAEPDPGSATELVADYHLANDVLQAGIDGIQHSVAKRYNPILSWLDNAASGEDEVLTNYGIRLARAAAWFNAQRLKNPQTAQNALDSLGRSSEVIVQHIVHPPVASLRIILRIARLMSRATRIWPRKTV